MNRKQFLLALVFVAVFSFLGGIVGGTMISGGGIIMAAKEIVEGSTMDNPKRIDYLKSELLEVGTIIANGVYLKSDSGYNIGAFYGDKSGDPHFALYRKENPLFVPDYWRSAFSIDIENSEPIMRFSDKDLDMRIWIGVNKLEPSIDFFYRNKTRLSLGTSYTLGKDTGNKTTLKGSVCTFDNKGNLTSQMP